MTREQQERSQKIAALIDDAESKLRVARVLGKTNNIRTDMFIEAVPYELYEAIVCMVVGYWTKEVERLEKALEEL